MRDENTLNLNQKTMCEMAQLWVDHTFKDPAPRVTKVATKEVRAGYHDDSDGEFVLTLREAGNLDGNDPSLRVPAVAEPAIASED